MIYLSLVIALGIGYAIGILQNGIFVNIQKYDPLVTEEPQEPNKSYGIPDYQEYYEETEGMNKF